MLLRIDQRASIDIPYTKYVLLLFLAIKLKDGQGGWVTKSELEQEGVLDDENINHINSLLSELRACFRGEVAKPKEFIKNIRGKSQYRISTAPNNISAPHTKWLKQKYNGLIKQVKAERTRRKALAAHYRR